MPLQITFTLTNFYVSFPPGHDTADAARDKLWDVVVHPATPETPEMIERKIRNEERTLDVVVELKPGESKLIQITQACGWMLCDWKSKVSADIEEL